MKKAVVRNLEQQQLKKEIPNFKVGDTVSVHTRIIEGGKERIQIFTGTVIARKGGGLSETFSIHRVAYGEGMERVFPLHSPRVAKIEVVRQGDVRRSKLYNLRGTTGKKAKVKTLIGGARPTKAVNGEKPAEEVAELETETVIEAQSTDIASDTDNANTGTEAAEKEKADA